MCVTKVWGVNPGFTDLGVLGGVLGPGLFSPLDF
jgi:hypothetical protein